MDTVIDPSIWPILSSIFSYNQTKLSFPLNAISMDHLSPLDPLCINYHISMIQNFNGIKVALFN